MIFLFEVMQRRQQVGPNGTYHVFVHELNFQGEFLQHWHECNFRGTKGFGSMAFKFTAQKGSGCL